MNDEGQMMNEQLSAMSACLFVTWRLPTTYLPKKQLTTE
jgi:hypothetical protein